MKVKFKRIGAAAPMANLLKELRIIKTYNITKVFSNFLASPPD